MHGCTRTGNTNVSTVLPDITYLLFEPSEARATAADFLEHWYADAVAFTVAPPSLTIRTQTDTDRQADTYRHRQRDTLTDKPSGYAPKSVARDASSQSAPPAGPLKARSFISVAPARDRSWKAVLVGREGRGTPGAHTVSGTRLLKPSLLLVPRRPTRPIQELAVVARRPIQQKSSISSEPVASHAAPSSAAGLRRSAVVGDAD